MYFCYFVGFYNKSISHRKGTRVDYANSFVLEIGYNEYECLLAGQKHNWEWPERAKRLTRECSLLKVEFPGKTYLIRFSTIDLVYKI
jgi:hypothetical protein